MKITTLITKYYYTDGGPPMREEFTTTLILTFQDLYEMVRIKYHNHVVTQLVADPRDEEMMRVKMEEDVIAVTLSGRPDGRKT